MALEVGELVAYLKLDDTQYNKALGGARGALQSFGSQASKFIDPIAQGFTLATAAGTGLAVSLVKQGAAYNTLQQQSRAALSTLLGGAENANAQMDKLDDFARNSPFAKSTFISAQQQLLGFGVEAEKVIPYLDAIQQSVAATGGSSQQLSEISYVMAQVSAAGKITATDLMQFGQRGIDAATLIGSQMGKTGAQIRDEITKGTLGADDALDALAAGMQATYGGAAEGVKNTWVGATDRIKGAVRDISSVIAAPFIDPNGGGVALDWANSLADLLRAVEGQAKPLITELLPKIMPVADAISLALKNATVYVKSADIGTFLDQISALSEYAAPLAGVGGALVAIGISTSPLGALVGKINPVVGAIIALVAASDDVRDALGRAASAAAPLADDFADLMRAGGDLANTVLAGLADILVDVANGAGEAGGPVDLLSGGFDLLTGTIQLVNDVAGPLLGWLGDLIGASEGATGPILAVVAALVLMRNIDVAGVMQKAAGAVTAASEAWKASKANFSALVDLGRDAGVVSTSMLAASVGVEKLGNSLKTAFVSNAPMLAITVLAATIGYFMQKAGEAKQNTDDLADSFDKLTGAATAQTDQIILDKLNDSISAADWEKLKEMGFTYEEFVAAVRDGGSAYDDLQKKVEKATDSATDGKQVKALEGSSRAVYELGDSYSLAADQAAEAADQTQAMTQAQRDAESSASAAKDASMKFQDALKVLSDNASSAEDRLSALHDIMDIMAGNTPTVTDATIKQADALRDAEGAAKDYQFSQEQLAAVLNEDGSLNLQSEVVSKVRGNMMDLTDATIKQADALGKAGDVEGATQAYRDLDEQLTQVGKAAGMSDEQIAAMKKSLGLLPAEQMVDLQVNGDQATEAIDTVNGKIWSIPASVTAYINGDTTGIDTKVDETGLRLAYLNGQKADPTITGDDSQNVAMVGAALDRLNEIDQMKPTPELLAEKQVLENVVTGAHVDLDSLKDKNVNVTALTHGKYDVDSLGTSIDQVKSKTVTITAVQRGFDSATGNTPGPWKSGYRFNADGNLYTAPGRISQFANGSENHVAQIARGGDWRVWAEDETGGEAYIPLAQSKRQRSLAITQDVAARFGYLMVPATAQRHANGSSGLGAMPSPAAPAFQGPLIGEVNLPPNTTPEEFINAAATGLAVQLNL